MTKRTRALVVIDLQNDYFPGGALPLWNPETTLANIEQAIGQARAQGIPVIHVQHVSHGPRGGLFDADTPGVAIHPRILAAAPDAPVVTKAFADGFWQTTLDDTLQSLGVDDLLICGMMTQNCVTHTAISKSAEKYGVTVLSDCCTTVSELIHKFAVKAMTTRVAVETAAVALGERGAG
ncbi:cysteine hydrolase family protein [Burkholderia sp. Ac-20379]|uniref:cysteine hydrolase family protein n=1 Tax=Burkholderia sp. Ac-20379 TaxID=2703900 RepID=UPI0019810AAD|nr:cysteine hydrolase family protein [Burkholderia sp. Ac-20379]MBN3724990.1 cysteine hydrolase [Burkholderia sp. Ac-20379]